MRLLIVDDNELFRQELAELLRDLGHEVVDASSADHAVEVLEASRFDAMLTDLKMPHRSGSTLLDDVAVRWPDLRSVILTGQPSEEAIAGCLRHGAINFVGKPFQAKHVEWVLDLVRRDIEYESQVAPPWTPEAARALLADRPVGSVAIFGRVPVGLETVGRPVMDRPGRTEEVVRHVHRAIEGAREPVIVLSLGGARIGALDAGPILSWVRAIRAGADRKVPIVTVVNRPSVGVAFLLAVWNALDGGVERADFRAAAGPQRRAVLERLRGRDLDLDVITREVGGRDGVWMRLYMDNLVEGGLVVRRGDRYSLTALGDRVSQVVTRASAAGGVLEDRARLYTTTVEPAAPSDSRPA